MPHDYFLAKKRGKQAKNGWEARQWGRKKEIEDYRYSVYCLIISYYCLYLLVPSIPPNDVPPKGFLPKSEGSGLEARQWGAKEREKKEKKKNRFEINKIKLLLLPSLSPQSRQIT